MVDTNDLQLQLAYRLGETAAPSDSTTKNQRLEWLNLGYLDISRRRNWWWLEASNTSNINTGSTTGYNEPADCKEFIELKINNIYYDQIPYKKNRVYQGVGAVVRLPTVHTSYKFYRFGGKYYLLPIDSGDGSVHQIKYWKRATKVPDGGTFLIPDEYTEALAAYAEARYWMSISQQAKAVAPMQEFESIVAQMNQEQGMRGAGWSNFGINDPDEEF